MSTFGRSTPDEASSEPELRDMITRLDPIPELVVSDARAAFRHRRPGGTLLELTYDSAATDDPAVPAPEGEVRLLAFQGGGARLELRLEPEPDDSWSLTGWLDPIGQAKAALHTPDTAVALLVDTSGAFYGAGVGGGPISVTWDLCADDEVRGFHTVWVMV